MAGWSVFPVGPYLKIRDALPSAELVDASALTTTLRMVKSPAEIALMRQASRISDRAMAAGLAEIRAGNTEAQVVASKPTRDFDQGRMGGAITPDRFVSLVYTDLSRKEQQTK